MTQHGAGGYLGFAAFAALPSRADRYQAARTDGQTDAGLGITASSPSICCLPRAVLPKVLTEARVATATGCLDAAPTPGPRRQLPLPEGKSSPLGSRQEPC